MKYFIDKKSRNIYFCFMEIPNIMAVKNNKNNLSSEEIIHLKFNRNFYNNPRKRVVLLFAKTDTATNSNISNHRAYGNVGNVLFEKIIAFAKLFFYSIFLKMIYFLSN